MGKIRGLKDFWGILMEHYLALSDCSIQIWESPWRELNPRSLPYEGSALATVLQGHYDLALELLQQFLFFCELFLAFKAYWMFFPAFILDNGAYNFLEESFLNALFADVALHILKHFHCYINLFGKVFIYEKLCNASQWRNSGTLLQWREVMNTGVFVSFWIKDKSWALALAYFY